LSGPEVAGPVIVNAFLDGGEIATTLDDYAGRVRGHARKINLVLAYLEATRS
jgi:hypothetical protein